MYFRRDFVESTPLYRGVRLGLKRLPLVDGREATFWHLITAGDVEASRDPIEIRCERIRWPKPVIDRVPTAELFCWETTRGSEKRIVIAFDDFSYVVVLANRGGYILPWTAYPVDYRHQRRKLTNEYQAYKKANAAP